MVILDHSITFMVFITLSYFDESISSRNILLTPPNVVYLHSHCSFRIIPWSMKGPQSIWMIAGVIVAAIIPNVPPFLIPVNSFISWCSLRLSILSGCQFVSSPLILLLLNPIASPLLKYRFFTEVNPIVLLHSDSLFFLLSKGVLLLAYFHFLM